PDYLPVCTPALAGGALPLRTPADLAHHVLIHDETLYDEDEGARDRSSWGAWLRLAGAHGVDPGRGPRFANAVLALEAARAGQGVALVSRLSIAAHLASGELAVPFDIALPSPRAYYLVVRAAIAERPAVRAFRDWLLQAARGAAR